MTKLNLTVAVGKKSSEPYYVMIVISLCYNKVYVWGTGVRLVYWHQKTEKEAWKPSPKVTRS